MKIEIIFYTLPNGRSPIREFLDSLDDATRAKTVRIIRMLADEGPETLAGCSKSLGDGLFELRATSRHNATRVLYFFYCEQQAVLTNGFMKKTRKTPAEEIDRARRYRRDYLDRKGSDEDE